MLGDNDDFVFIGWPGHGTGVIPLPIIVQKNIRLDNPNANRFERYVLPNQSYAMDTIFNYDDMTYIFRMPRWALSLDQLYKLPNIRGINLYNVAYNRYNGTYRFFLEGTEPVVFNYPLPLRFFNTPNPLPPEDTPQQWYERNREIIVHLERKYPGLFEPIFPEEVADAAAGVGGGKSRSRKSRRSKTIRRKRKI